MVNILLNYIKNKINKIIGNNFNSLRNSKTLQLSIIKTPPKNKVKKCCGNFIKKSINISDVVSQDPKFSTKYKIIKIIYEHTNKAAYMVKSKIDNNEYILKMKTDDYDNTDEFRIYKILKNKKNNYIIKFIECVKRTDYQYFVYEYFNGMTLYDFITDNYDDITEKDIKDIFIKIVNAVKFLHSQNIIHCDLKLDNILIDNENNIKIIDFDLSKICEDEYISNGIFGTMQYIAPESYDLCIYSKKSDVWGLGIILYTLITKKFPYHDENFPIRHSYENMCRRNKFKHPDILEMKHRVKEFNYNKNVINLVGLMLTFEDYKRICLDDVLKFNW